MMKVLYYDIAALMIQLILLISLFFRKMLSGRTNRIFALLLTLVLVTTMADLWAASFAVWLPARESNTWLRAVLHYTYLLLHSMTTPMYHLFLCAITDTWHVLTKNKWLKWLLAMPFTVICCTLFTNPFHHMVYYFDENLAYTRGPMMYLLYAAAAFYILCGVGYLFRYKKLLTADKFVALILMYPFNVLAILIQMLFPGYLVEMFMTTLTLLLIALVIQRPEETIHPILGVRSYIAYTLDMKKTFSVHKPVRIILAKLVNFKALSSLLEYDACNLLLKKIAADLLSSYKEEHLPMDVYYLENGRFALVTEKELPEKTEAVAWRISGSFTKSIPLEQFELNLDACICILRCPEDIDNYENLLSFGNSFHRYLPSGGAVNAIAELDDRRMFRLRNELDRIISNAIAEKRFRMYYQPIYSVKEKKFLSAEALIRLYDEHYGFISPELFISAAERNGTIFQIGDFVLDEVCSFLARSEKDGLPIDYIELNLSMAQCMQKDLVEKVLHYQKKYHLRPEQINLEITETAANTAQDIVEENIRNLSKEGISFSVDDYGTGYSNISRIMSLPFRIIKLDKSLADKVDDSRMKVLLRNTIRMLKEIGMEIVVEGVETKDALQQFTELECDYIQGYYFSKPLPEQEFVEFIRKSLNQRPSENA